MGTEKRIIGKTLLAEQLKSIKRLLHAAKSGNGKSAKPSMRAGLSSVRRDLEHTLYPQLIDSLWSGTLYRNVLSIAPFPRTYKVFNTHKRLSEIPLADEFIWQSAILVRFTDELNLFLAEKQGFDTAQSENDTTSATTHLDTIEEKLGVSLWLISARLKLLQASSGLAAQKSYLESTINTDGLNTWAAWLAYYFSKRSEDNVSYTSLHEELYVALETKNVGDFLKFHVFPGDAATIENNGILLNWIEPYPVIDRYITLVNMAKVQISKHGVPKSQFLLESTSLLKAIKDPELRRIESILNDDLDSYYSESLLIYDAYFGCDAFNQDSKYGNNLELAARSLSYHPSPPAQEPSGSQSLIKEAIGLMRDILTVADNYRSAVSRLQKISLILDDRNKSVHIMAFLNKAEQRGRLVEINELMRLDAISPALSVLSPTWITGIRVDSERFHILSKMFPDSVTLAILRVSHASYESAKTILDGTSIPPFRRNQLLGTTALRERDFAQANQHLSECENSPIEFVRIQAKRMRVHALITEENIERALEIVINHCLERPNAYRLYPTEDLLRLALNDDVLRCTVDVAILIHFASRNLNTNWERDLSDSYENVLGGVGVTKPTLLFDVKTGWPSEKLIYFLRYICVSRVMDDTIEFESIDEIEQERILVCQWLIANDTSNANSYSLEIRTITREATIFALLKTVESSKIYVDEDGIRSVSSELLLDDFIRYQQLSQSPELGYQAANITKRIGKLLGDNAPDDIKSFMPPASEREGLFDGMLNSFVSHFALNPAYGLDTHVSTTIRHGAIEGHIRSPLAAQEILTITDKSSGSSHLSKKWRTVFQTSDHLSEVTKYLQRFTTRVEDEISRLNDKVLRVRSEEYPVGFFSFKTGKIHVDALSATIGATATFKDLIDKFFQFCWANVDRSLKDIVIELHRGTLHNINSAVDSLLSSLPISGDNDIRDLRDAIIRSKTDLQGAIDGISHWFNLPRDLFREPFDLDLAIEVALKQIHNCYVHSGVEAKKEISEFGKLPGKYLDGLVEIFFIVVQNVILHSGISDSPLKIDFSIDAFDGGDAIEINVCNAVSTAIRIEDMQAFGRDAVNNYKRDTAMQRARQEGGSGLSKVWRIAEYDLRCKHFISIEIGSDYIFRLSLRLEGLR